MTPTGPTNSRTTPTLVAFPWNDAKNVLRRKNNADPAIMGLAARGNFEKTCRLYKLAVDSGAKPTQLCTTQNSQWTSNNPHSAHWRAAVLHKYRAHGYTQAFSLHTDPQQGFEIGYIASDSAIFLSLPHSPHIRITLSISLPTAAIWETHPEIDNKNEKFTCDLEPTLSNDAQQQIHALPSTITLVSRVVMQDTNETTIGTHPRVLIQLVKNSHHTLFDKTTNRLCWLTGRAHVYRISQVVAIYKDQVPTKTS